MNKPKLTITVPCPFCGSDLKFRVEKANPHSSSLSVLLEEEEVKQEQKCVCGKKIILRGCSILLLKD